MIRNSAKRMKYLIGVTAILFLILIYSSNIVKADNEADFVIKDGVLLEYVGNAEDVIIPVGVTSIDKDVFDDKNIKSVVIPDGVTEIKEWTFFQSSLESIDIPESVVSIGMGAFCESNLKKIILPDGIAIIPKRAFDSCKNLTEVKLPKNLLYINPEAFKNTGLTAIEIPDRVKTIGGEAFFESDLVTVTMSDSVIEIGFAAFQDCHKLKKVSFSNNLEIISGSAFMYCTKLQSLDIPKSVTDIGEDAFFGCKSIKSMTIYGRIKEIKSMTFGGCISMTKISYPDSVTKIGYAAFSNTGFKTLPITKFVKSIGRSAFIDNKITSIKVPEGVQTIGSSAFARCENLKSVYIPKSVTSIGSEAFGQCENLEKLTIINPICKIYNYESDNMFFKGSKIYMLKKVKLFGYKGSTTEDLSKVLNVKFVSIDKTAIDYPELINKKEPKVVTDKDSYTVAVGKEIKIPYKVKNGNGATVKVTGGIEYFDGLGYEVAKVIKITDDYIIIKGGKWTGTVTIMIRAGFTSKTIKITVK